MTVVHVMKAVVVFGSGDGDYDSGACNEGSSSVWWRRR